MTTTFSVTCPCGICGERREATDEGFNATTVDVDVAACDNMGMASIAVMRKSWGYDNVWREPVYRHRDGLVTLEGSGI